MSKRAKIILVAGAVVVLVIAVCTRASFHLTKEITSCNSTTSSGQSGPSGDRLRLFRTVAVVAPRKGSADIRLGDLIARKLEEKLSSKAIARDFHRGERSWVVRHPKVTIYETASAAKRNKADFYITIQPEAYNYSLWPFAKDWTARVKVYGSPVGPHASHEVIGPDISDLGVFYFDSTFDYSGRIVGVFPPSYVTDKAAEEITKSVTEEMQEHADDLVNDFLNKKKGN